MGRHSYGVLEPMNKRHRDSLFGKYFHYPDPEFLRKDLIDPKAVEFLRKQEPLRAKASRLRYSRHAPPPGTHSEVAVRMVKAAAYWQSRGMTFVFKGTGSEQQDVLTVMERLLGAYVVVGDRINRLDRLICAIRDCFGKRLGYIVDGQRRVECKFRKRVGKVHINAEEMLDALKENVTSGYLLKKLLQDSGFSDVIVLNYEDLAAFQWSSNPESFVRSCIAWSRLLRSWGVIPDKRIVRQYMQQFVGTVTPPKPHVDEIANFEEIKAALQPYPELLSLLRF